MSVGFKKKRILRKGLKNKPKVMEANLGVTGTVPQKKKTTSNSGVAIQTFGLTQDHEKVRRKRRKKNIRPNRNNVWD